MLRFISGHGTLDDETRKQELYHYGSFLVWPFGVMLASLRHWRQPFSRNIFWLFCIFFGLTFVIAEGEMTADSEYYARLLTTYANSNMDMSDLWRSFYSESSNYVDIVQPIITYLVSRITSNPIVLFTVFGTIFGFFYTSNIWYVLGRLEGKITPVLFVYILTLALLNPIWNINGFRMWTAAQIFLFGALPYFFEGKAKNLLWSAFAILVHFSFVYPVAVLTLYYFLRNRIDIYFGFFIITSFIKELDLDFVRESLSFLPGFLQARVTGYTNLEYAEFRADRMELHNWYISYSRLAMRWVVYCIAIFVYLFFKRNLSGRKDLLSLFCFTVLLYGFANIFSLVPSGERVLTVATIFMFSFAVVLMSVFAQHKGLSVVRTVLLPFLVLFCVVKIREGMDFYGLVTIIGNPVFGAFYADSVPLIEEIKGLL
ncbi:MAG TPA: EpsG family protein [Bacteroidales bacterium]|nr:EpsG family protein [Bacteroidales bacterium]HPJ60199.1 EpsG family protein [Bacteroidales bacterium]HPR13099.1 EpsG family protein [Bacteroidales bacterium]